MKKKNLVALTIIVVLVAMLALTLSACEGLGGGGTGGGGAKPTLTGITVDKDRTTSELYVDANGTEDSIKSALSIIAKTTMSDNSSTPIDVSALTIDVSQVDITKEGEYLVTVTYQTYSATFTVTVKEYTVTSIEIDSSSTHKTEFAYDEEFSSAGLTVKVNFAESDAGSTLISTGFTVDSSLYIKNHNSSEKQTYTINVNYKTTSLAYDVKVAAKPIAQATGIRIVNEAKKSFAYGEQFSAEGLSVSTVLADGTYGDTVAYPSNLITVNSNNYSAYHQNEAENGQSYEISVTYSDKTIKYNVTVARAPAHIVSAELVTGASAVQSTQFEYGASFTTGNGISIVLTMSYGDPVTVTDSDEKVTIISSAFVGAHNSYNAQDYTIYAFYDGNSAGSYTVTVAAKPAPKYESIAVSAAGVTFNSDEVFSSKGATVYAIKSDGSKEELPTEDYKVTCASCNSETNLLPVNTTQKVATYVSTVELTAEAKTKYSLTGDKATASYNVFTVPTDATVSYADCDTSAMTKRTFDYGYTATAADFAGLILHVTLSTYTKLDIVLDENGEADGVVIDLDTFNFFLSDNPVTPDSYKNKKLGFSVSYKAYNVVISNEMFITRLAKTTPASVTEIYIGGESAYRTSYRVGEVLDTEGLVVKAKWDNGTLTDLTEDDYTVTVEGNAATTAFSLVKSAVAGYIPRTNVTVTYKQNTLLNAFYDINVASANMLIHEILIETNVTTSYFQYINDFFYNESFTLIYCKADDTTVTEKFRVPFSDNRVRVDYFDNNPLSITNNASVALPIKVNYFSKPGSFYGGNDDFYIDGIINATLYSVGALTENGNLLTFKQDLNDKNSLIGTDIKVTYDYFLGDEFSNPEGTFIAGGSSKEGEKFVNLDAGKLQFFGYDPTVIGEQTITYKYVITANGAEWIIASDSYNVNVATVSATEAFDAITVYDACGKNANLIDKNGFPYFEFYMNESSSRFKPEFKFTASSGIDEEYLKFISYELHESDDPSSGSSVGAGLDTEEVTYIYPGDVGKWFCMTLTTTGGFRQSYFIHIAPYDNIFSSFTVNGKEFAILPGQNVFCPVDDAVTLGFTVKDGYTALVKGIDGDTLVDFNNDVPQEYAIDARFAVIFCLNDYSADSSVSYYRSDISFTDMPTVKTITVCDYTCTWQDGHYYVSVDGANTYPIAVTADNGYTVTVARNGINLPLANRVFNAKMLKIGDNLLTVTATCGEVSDTYGLNINVKDKNLCYDLLVKIGEHDPIHLFNINGVAKYDGVLTSDPAITLYLNAGVKVSAVDLYGNELNWANGGTLALTEGRNNFYFKLEKNSVAYYLEAILYKTYEQTIDVASLLDYADVTVYGYRATRDSTSDGDLLSVLLPEGTLLSKNDIVINFRANDYYNSCSAKVLSYKNGTYAVKLTYTISSTGTNDESYFYVQAKYFTATSTNMSVTISSDTTEYATAKLEDDGYIEYAGVAEIAQGTTIAVNTADGTTVESVTFIGGNTEQFADPSLNDPLTFSIDEGVGTVMYLYVFAKSSDGKRASYVLAITVNDGMNG